MRISIIGNGDFVPAKALLAEYDFIIAADGGLRHCHKLGITPHHCIGDGDSMLPEEKTNPLVKIVPDQNTTDLQKALASAAQLATGQPYTVELFSMTSGERLDHSWFALQTLATNSVVTAIYTPQQIIRCVRTNYTWQQASGRTISLLPVGLSATVKLTGFVWSGETVTLDSAHPGISNCINAEHASLTVSLGAVYSFEPTLWM